MLLTDKTAVISGAASARGIGRATAQLSPSKEPGSPSSIWMPLRPRVRPRNLALITSELAVTSATSPIVARPLSRPSRLSARSTFSSTTPASPSRLN